MKALAGTTAIILMMCGNLGRKGGWLAQGSKVKLRTKIYEAICSVD